MTTRARNWMRTAEDLKEGARDLQNAVSDRAQNTGRVIHEYVHENAWKTLAVGVLLGAAVGFILARTRD